MAMSYEESLEYLFPLVRAGTKLGLENITELLSHIGNPHGSLMSVHVAGSKGKGSVCSFISSILKEAGYRVGTFTSPHLVDFTERIRINWEPIPEEDVVRLVSELKPIADRMSIESITKSPSFFEIATAMAFKYFEEKEVDFAVIEAGMGGRYDSTNVITPVLSVFTHLSMEHSEHLGRSLARIAKDKAGIVKDGVPVILSERSDVIEQACKKRACDLTILGEQIRFGRDSFDASGQDFWVENGDRKEFHLNLLGNFQVQNAATAYAAAIKLRELEYEISDEAMRNGFESARWPGRLHVIQKNPIVVVDSTHDFDGATKLIESLKELFSYDKVVTVFAALEDKDVERIASVLGPFSNQVICTQVDYHKALPASRVEKSFKDHNEEVTTISTVNEALDIALREANDGDLVCITGSIFTASEAFAYFGKSAED
jgi:dihydrofolate synthase/folylpolyglutamate synthase